MMKRVLFVVTGLSFSLLGFLGVLFSIVEIIDPAGAKMADDGDPFGPPRTIQESLVVLAGYVGVTGLGGWLTWRGSRGHGSAPAR